jgi:hypothetical protein
MSNDPAYLLEQAAKCRRLAKAVLDRDGAERLKELADYYQECAENMKAGAPEPGPVLPTGGVQPA